VTAFTAEILLALAAIACSITTAYRAKARDYRFQLWFAAAWTLLDICAGVAGDPIGLAVFSLLAVGTAGHWLRRHSRWGWR
jgi:hypothetical protein